MKIKIIKANDESWYRHLVGKVRVARQIDYLPELYILRNYRTLFRGVRKEHAEIIEP